MESGHWLSAIAFDLILCFLTYARTFKTCHFIQERDGALQERVCERAARTLAQTHVKLQQRFGFERLEQ
jgi:hypothetical protein